MAKAYSKSNGFIQKHKRKDNVSGVTGVSLDKRSGRWSSRLTFNGKLYGGSRHADKVDAIIERLRLEFCVLGINDMPQANLIPEYIRDEASMIYHAWAEVTKCHQHPDRRADYARDSFIPGSSAIIPICAKCMLRMSLEGKQMLRVRPIGEADDIDY